MKWWIWSLFVFNITDTVSTLLVVLGGRGREVNPLMEALLNASPWYFVAVKAAAGILILSILNMKCSAPFQRLVKMLTMTYGALMFWHAICWIKISSL